MSSPKLNTAATKCTRIFQRQPVCATTKAYNAAEKISMHRTNIRVIIRTHSNTFKRRTTHARARVTIRYMISSNVARKNTKVEKPIRLCEYILAITLSDVELYVTAALYLMFLLERVWSNHRHQIII